MDFSQLPPGVLAIPATGAAIWMVLRDQTDPRLIALGVLCAAAVGAAAVLRKRR